MNPLQEKELIVSLHDNTDLYGESTGFVLSTSNPPQSTDNVDLRQACYNGMAVGDFSAVQLAQGEIIRLDAIAIDVDPGFLRNSLLFPMIPWDDPRRVYHEIVAPMLARDPALAGAEVRDTGTGLHVLLRPDQPIEFQTEIDRRKWSSLVEIIQAVLPSDPHAPGITMVTRPIGSINSKNCRTVTRVADGYPVAVDSILGLVDRMRRAPAKTIFGIWFGTDRLQPCPICGKGRGLIAKSRNAKCYTCGTIELPQLLDLAYLNRQSGNN